MAYPWRRPRPRECKISRSRVPWSSLGVVDLAMRIVSYDDLRKQFHESSLDRQGGEVFFGGDLPIHLSGGQRRYTQCVERPAQRSLPDMRTFAIAFSAIVMLAGLTAANATDLNGKWKGDMKTANGDTLEINFNFQVDGEKLTGTVANTYGEEQITEGRSEEHTSELQ